mmetsp:Transcript_7125/g.44156  ORF Transcript_7125/g.44156 Transcript_7125/m.44156 type:complete len:266 (+) Transcript_7125:1376-2173(+)
MSLTKRAGNLGEVLDGTSPSCQSLNAKAKESNHGKSAMLDLSLLHGKFLFRLAWICQVERVEVSSWVATLLDILFSIALDLHKTHCKDLNHYQLGDRKGKGQPCIGGTIKLHLASLHPVDTSDQLCNNGSQHGKHGPAPMDKLALTVTIDIIQVVIRDNTIAHCGRLWLHLSEEGPSLVHSLVLIERVHVEEQVLSWLGETCWIESTVPWEGSVQPLGCFGVGKPQRTFVVSSLRCFLDGATLGTTLGATFRSTLRPTKCAEHAA